LKFRENEENGYSNFYDLGYRFSENYWGKGYAKEAAFFWINYGYNALNLEMIHACAEDKNTASNNLLKTIGFTFTNQYFVNDILHNWYIIKK